MSSAVESSDRRLRAAHRVTRSVAIRLGLVSTAAFFGAVTVLGVVFEVVTGRALAPVTVTASSPLELLLGALFVIGLLAFVVVPHELVHGLVMRRYGAAPTYGVGVSAFVLPYAYAESSEPEPTYTRNQLLVIALAPFVVITAVGLVLLVVVQSPLLILPIAANAAGSVGDCWLAAVLLSHPSSVRVAGLPGGQDRGVAVYGSSADGPAAGWPFERSLVAFVTGVAGTATLLVFGLFASVAASLAFGSGDVVLGDPDGVWFLLRHELESDGYAVSIEWGDLTLVALSTVGGLAWTVGSAVARASRPES